MDNTYMWTIGVRQKRENEQSVQFAVLFALREQTKNMNIGDGRLDCPGPTS